MFIINKLNNEDLCLNPKPENIKCNILETDINGKNTFCEKELCQLKENKTELCE